MLNIPISEAISATNEMIYDAYRICLTKMNSRRLVATQTLKKWFGIGDYMPPNREKLIQLFFALQLSDIEARNWMVHGALEPDFQINDFREIIYLYGLYNQLSYEECEDMIQTFISSIQPNITLEQHNYTADLWNAYGRNVKMSRDEFVNWMLSIQTSFKGYSLTVLNYFTDLKQEIIRKIQIDAENSLQYYLAETNLPAIKNLNKNSPNRRRTILRHLRQCENGKGKHISHDLCECIRELLALADTPLSSNTALISTLYANTKTLRDTLSKYPHHNQIRIMSDKYLSELMHVSEQKELELAQLLSGTSKEKLREQKRRCRILTRNDLLPLIHCVSEYRYHEETANFPGELNDFTYETKDARDYFCKLANRILTSCNMASFNPESYLLDYILYHSFTEDEMLNYSDAILAFLEESNRKEQ